MKKLFSLVMAFALVLGSNCLAVNAAELSNDISEETQQEAIDLVENFILDAYDEYYNVNNFDSSIDSLTIENGVGEIVVKSNFEKILKASDVSQLPYIQGMTDSVRNLEKTRSNDVMLAQFVLDEQVLAVSEYIGEAQEENAIFKVSFDVSPKDLSDATLEVFEIDEFIPAKYFLPETSEKLYTDGLSELQDNVESTKNALAVAYPDVDLKNGLSLDKLKSSNVKSITYDRIAARDYANTYTSECGSGYDTSY